jgi:hypothetical protein
MSREDYISLHMIEGLKYVGKPDLKKDILNNLSVL